MMVLCARTSSSVIPNSGRSPVAVVPSHRPRRRPSALVNILLMSATLLTSLSAALVPSTTAAVAFVTVHGRSSRRRTSVASEAAEKSGPFVLSPEEADAAVAPLMEIAAAHFQSQALSTIVRLGIPDVLGRETLTVPEILERITDGTTVHRDALARCLRVLSAVGVLTESSTVDATCAYALTPTGALLQTDAGDMASGVRHWTEGPLWDAWLELPGYVTDGAPELPFARANNGTSPDDFYGRERHPDSLAHANGFARFVHDQEVRAVVHGGFDWERHLGGDDKTLVDVGGNNGKLVAAVAAAFPTIGRCVCLDLPEVVASVTDVPPGVDLLGGDVLDPATIPACDVVLMKHILDKSMWDEAQSVAILQSCHAALRPGGRIVLGEAVLPDAGEIVPDQRVQIFVDALFLLVGRASQRTRAEWAALADRGGFRIETVVPTACPSCHMIVLEKKEERPTTR